MALAIIGVVLLVASLAGAGHDHAAGHDGEGGEHNSPAAALLSVRFWTYLLAFGGLTGVLLRVVGHAAEPVAAIGALAVGVVAAVMARVILARASRPSASGMVQSSDLVGRTGDVIVPFADGSTGKVRVRVAGAAVDVLATADAREALEKNDEVLIVEVRDEGTAVVTKSPASR